MRLQRGRKVGANRDATARAARFWAAYAAVASRLAPITSAQPSCTCAQRSAIISPCRIPMALRRRSTREGDVILVDVLFTEKKSRSVRGCRVSIMFICLNWKKGVEILPH